jgi:NAD(P)-dependent dehydrogenase (short-subunit alcohol dehydrogenase family)
MTGLLQNKVALITGAASGIGRATAQLFARQGAKVAVADINEAGGQETVDSIRGAGGDAIFVRADVGRMDDVRTLVQATHDHYARLDIVHSNAYAHRLGNALEISEADWDFTLAVCLKATWMLAHHALPIMLAGGGGTIVITGSVHAIRGYANHAAYDAAKGGLLALTRNLAMDFAPTVRVNTILPGAVVTGAWTGASERRMARVAQTCPLKRNGMPEEIAQVALFLASDMSSFMTGTSVVVDGGLTAVIEVPDED